MAEEENQFVKLVSAEGMEVRTGTVDLDGSNMKDVELDWFRRIEGWMD